MNNKNNFEIMQIEAYINGVKWKFLSKDDIFLDERYFTGNIIL